MVMKFGVRIKEAREKAKLTQIGLAELVKVTQGSVYQWEKDISAPSTAKLADVAIVTGVSFEWLATGRDQDRIAEPSQAYHMNQSEADLLKAFRALSEKKKKALLVLIS